jgi:bile acid:Na+ symporter, BASS family
LPTSRAPRAVTNIHDNVREHIHDILKVALAIAIPVASFATGLTAAGADPLWLPKHPRLWVRSLVIILLVVPVGVVLLMEALGTPDVVKAALTIAVISIGIGPPAAFKKAQSHKEIVAYEVGLNLTLLAVALIYLPLAVAVHGAIFHHTVQLGVGQVAGVVLVKALVPMVLGVLAGRLFPKLVAPFAKYAAILVQVVLAAIVVLALIATWRRLFDLGTIWLLCLAIVIGEIAVGHIFGRKDPQTRGMLVAFSAMRFPALALLLAHAAPRGRELIPVILAYVLCSFVLVAVYEGMMSRRRRGEHAPLRAAPQRRAAAEGHA